MAPTDNVPAFSVSETNNLLCFVSSATVNIHEALEKQSKKRTVNIKKYAQKRVKRLDHGSSRQGNKMSIAYFSRILLLSLSSLLYSPVTVSGYLDDVFTMASLTKLERVAGIPVLTELEAKRNEFQAVIRVKQSDLSWAIKKWLTASERSRIKPTWKNFFLVLQLINLGHLVVQIRNYFKTHSPSSFQEEGNGTGMWNRK